MDKKMLDRVEAGGMILIAAVLLGAHTSDNISLFIFVLIAFISIYAQKYLQKNNFIEVVNKCEYSTINNKAQNRARRVIAFIAVALLIIFGRFYKLGETNLIIIGVGVSDLLSSYSLVYRHFDWTA